MTAAGSPEAPAGRPALVLDCDPGIDDAVAILVAARYGDLVALTTVAGNAPVADTTANALVVAEVAGLDVEVHRGAPRPLISPHHGAEEVHGPGGFGSGPRPPVTRRAAGDDAVGELSRRSRERAGLNLVAVGPLTNVALALRTDPGLAGRLAGIYVMGGAWSGGNASAVAEFNLWADPEAAAIVLGDTPGVRLVPLEVTRQVRLGPRHLDRLRQAGTAAAALVVRLLEHYLDPAEGPAAGAVMHDACAVLALTHPSLFEWEDCYVAVELAGSHTRGMTVVDRRRVAPPPNVQLATEVDFAAALELIVEAAIDPSEPR